MILFLAEDLKPVIQEAQKNKCALLLVKDQGLYFMSSKGSFSEINGRKMRTVAYAQGCNPFKDEAWWDFVTTVAGGDDFGEEINMEESMMKLVCENGWDLHVQFTRNQISIEAKPK